MESWEKTHGIRSGDFCKNRVKKQVTGGSDDHMGLFAGTCGTYLHVPDLRQKLKSHNMADLALEAIRSGSLHPYGTVANHEKLNIAFIDYLSQIALNMGEPGLLRMFLHKGSQQRFEGWWTRAQRLLHSTPGQTLEPEFPAANPCLVKRMQPLQCSGPRRHCMASKMLLLFSMARCEIP